MNVTRSAPASAPSTKKSSVLASRAVRKIRASTPWRNGSAAFCCPEIHDDVSLDDAPYFSALYGPSRHAIVVPDLSRVAEQLEGLEDCPEDLYLIEGDPQSFDDSVFSVDELEKAVVVKIADRQWRYSRFPSLPLFGRAARENRIETLHAERESLSERFATLSFDVQKTQRLHQAFSRFIGSHLAVAFEDDPEEEIRKLNSRRGELERALSAHESDNQQNRVQYEQAKEGVSALNRLLPRLNLLADDTLADRVDEIGNVWTKRRRLRALFSSTVTSWRSWSLLFRCCRAIRSSLSS